MRKHWKQKPTFPEKIGYVHLHKGKKYAVSLGLKVYDCDECDNRLYTQVNVKEFLGYEKKRSLRSLLKKVDHPIFREIVDESLLLNMNNSYDCFLYNIETKSSDTELDRKFFDKVFSGIVPRLIEHKHGQFRVGNLKIKK